MDKLSNLDAINSCFNEGIIKNIMPAYYIIEPTNYCNYKCIMCPNKNYQKTQKGHMNIGLFKKIVDEVKKYAFFIQLYWMGEPFLSPILFEMIAYISANSKAKIIISTNGSLLDSDLIDKITYSNIYKLIISLDAAKSQSIYEQIRVGCDLATVNKNIALLLEKNSNIKIDLQFIDFNINKSEREEFNQMWSNKKCRLVYSWLNTWANQFEELKTETYYGSPNSLIQRMPCSDLWYKMSIHWNGEVSICCYDWDFQITFGNLNKESVKAIWNSELITQYRNFHKKNLFSKISLCSSCDEWATIEEYNDILM